MTRRAHAAIALVGGLALTVIYAVVARWALDADRLAGVLGLTTRQYHRVLAYPGGVLAFVGCLASYRYLLWPALTLLWPHARWPDPRAWYRRPWVYVVVVALVAWWLPLWRPGQTWRGLVQGVVRGWVVVAGVTVLYAMAVRRARPTGARTGWVNLGLSCLVVLYGCAGVESYFRLNLHTDGLGRDTLGTIHWFRVYVKWNHVPTGAKTHKFRDRPFTKTKPPGTLRIALIGDSVVFAQGVRRAQDRVGNRLERLLATQHHPVEVYNIAQCGNHLCSAIEWLNTVAVPYRCDLVVLMHNLNDIECVADQPDVDLPEPGPVWRWVLGRSFALSHLYHRTLLTRGFRTSYVDWLVEHYGDARLWDEYRKRLRAFFTLCWRRRLPAVFVQVPILPAVKDYPVGLLRIHRRLADVVREMHVPAMDLLTVFDAMDPLGLVVSPADRHPNERAHRLMADYLADRLRPLLPEARRLAEMHGKHR